MVRFGHEVMKETSAPQISDKRRCLPRQVPSRGTLHLPVTAHDLVNTTRRLIGVHCLFPC